MRFDSARTRVVEVGAVSASSLTVTRVAPSIRERLRVWLAVPLLSLVGHAVLVASMLGLSSLTAAPPKPKKPVSRPVTMRNIDSRRWAANRGKTALPSPAIEKPAELHPKGQIVDVAQGNNQISPDAKYLAESNNRVEKQTVAREQTNKYSKAAPKNAPNPMDSPLARGRSAPSLLGSTANELSEFGSKQQFAKLFQPPSRGQETSDAPVSNAAVGNEKSNEPTSDSTGTTEGGGAPNDDLHDVAKGDGTFLNTREWKYASFFNRVKQAVSAQWDPNGRLKAKNKQVYTDRVTVMAVALRPDGSIADLFVLKTSGVDELDQAAMNAFERAQPFANPPQELIVKGVIAFNFSFLVSNEGMGGFGSPQFFRSGR